MRLPALLAGAVVAAGCVSGGAEVEEPVPSLFDDPPSTTEAAVEIDPPAAPTTTGPIAERLPPLASNPPGAILSGDGTLLPILGTDGDVWFVLGPCGDDLIEPGAAAELVSPHHVVLDPGGSDDDGARINLAVAEQAAALLEARGVAVVLTRTGPVVLGASTRGAAGPAVGAEVLVSIHRGDGGSPSTEPRPTVFHRAGDADSRRLAGLIHQELTLALEPLDGEFAAHAEPGVRPLLNQRGDDYFRVLQASLGVAAARVELLTLGRIETALLATEEGREIEARALADAIVRFLVTSEEGNGFIDPIEAVRDAPTSDAPGGC